MGFNDTFRMSSHAVILNEKNHVLLLHATYGNFAWGLPGGALEPEETIHEALERECREELGLGIEIAYLSGVYYHAAHNSQAFIFRCHLLKRSTITLSSEHSQYKYTPIAELSHVQRKRIEDCLNFKGVVFSAKF